MITEQERNEQIQELRNKKVDLLNQFGAFGGGVAVNNIHRYTNRKLEVLGVYELHELTYDEWVNAQKPH